MKKTSIAITIILMSFATGCKESEVDSWVSQMENMKKEVLTLMNRSPYKANENAGFKNYFSKTWDFNWVLSQDKNKVKKLNETLARKDLNQLCEKVLIKKIDWDQIVKNCTVNRYFLCADQVREYQQALEVLKKYLIPQLANKFEQSASCRAAL